MIIIDIELVVHNVFRLIGCIVFQARVRIALIKKLIKSVLMISYKIFMEIVLRRKTKSYNEQINE